MQAIPKKTDVVVIGGGPGGATTAGFLAKKGIDVVVLDKAKHPRPAVGESLIPHIWKIAGELGFASTISDEGFLPKAGGVVVWDDKIQLMRFSDFGYTGRSGLHVERDRFDELLLRHAQKLGAQVHEEVICRSVDFAPDESVVHYTDKSNGESVDGRIQCRFVVDASGPAAFLAKQFDSRTFVQSDKKFLGLWGYFKNARYFGVDGLSHDPSEVHTAKPVTLVLNYEDGWIWHIVLRNETSVGLVMSTDKTKAMSKAEREEYFLGVCRKVPYLKDLLAKSEYVPGSLSFRPDYSYYSDKVVGDGFYCVGDAGAFVDPIFSQGVLTAMYHASMCAWSLSGQMQQPERKSFFTEMYRDRVLQYYGFSRLLAFGDFGGEGIDPNLVRKLVKSMPQNEVMLSFAASTSTARNDNLTRMVVDAGLDASYLNARIHYLDALHP
ncbi:tryptophan 7-halogenase [Myxococcota bacterium]|nr:tryptophan 7-halogenase [Myxococcota bacterium]